MKSDLRISNPMSLRRAATLAFVALFPLRLVAQEKTKDNPAPPVELLLQPGAANATINPLLLGTQFNFFSAPIKSRMDSTSLLDTWREMPVRVLRYPGGTWGDHYCWDNPAGSYFVSGDASTIITPTQFIEICRRVGAEPVFQVNTGSKGGNNDNRINPTRIEDIRKGAQTAAEWVRDANLVNKWGVKYWEIGNEVWIWLTPEEYASYVVEYSKAMKKVDSSIKIIACGLAGKVGPFNATWLNFPDDPQWTMRTAVVNDPESWNQALFTVAKGSFDYIAPHQYVSATRDRNDRLSSIEHYLKTTARIWDRESLLQQQEMVRKYRSSARLAITEWGCNFSESVSGRQKWESGLYYYSLGCGLSTAHYFGRILEGADVTDLAVLHSIDEVQTLWFWPANALASGAPLMHPAFQVMKVWGNHLGDKRMSLSSRNVPQMAIDGKDYPSIYCYPSEDRRFVYLVAINLSPSSEQSLHLRTAVTVSPAAKAECMWLTGDSIEANNFTAWEKPDQESVRITTSSINQQSRAWNVQMPPHSMVGIRIRKN